MSQKFWPQIEMEVRRYRTGGRLNLYSYTPVDPHGTTKYLPNNLPVDLTPGWVRGFDPTNLPPTPDLVLEVFEGLSWGIKKCNQITACKIVTNLENHHDHNVQGPREGQQWPELVICKAFDPPFYPILGGRGVDKAAEAALSREAGAYRYLYSNNMTGFPHPTAEFYGTYVAVFDLGLEDNNLIELGLEDKQHAYKCVPVILMERVEGFSMENLCTRHDTTHELILRNLLPIFHYDANGSPVTLALHKQNRKEIMRQVLDGLVKMLHVGLEFGAIEARQIMITIRHGRHDLEMPRAVVFDYTLSDIWCMTRVGKTVHRHRLYDLQKLPNPVHPMQIFDFEELHSTIGFWPSSYCYETTNDNEAREAEWARDSEGVRVRDDNGRLRHKCEVEYDEWLVETFGPFEEGRYSVYKTLYLIQEAEERAREAAAKEAFAVEKALRDWLRNPAEEAEEAAEWAAVKETSMELAMDAVSTETKRAFKDAHAEWYEEKERQEQKGGRVEDVAIDVTDDATADNPKNDDNDDDYEDDDDDNEDEIDYFRQFFGVHEAREAREAVAFQKAQELRDLKDALRHLQAGSPRDVPDVEQVRDALEVVRSRRHREARETEQIREALAALLIEKAEETAEDQDQETQTAPETRGEGTEYELALDDKASEAANNDPDAQATMLRRVIHGKIAQLPESLSRMLNSSGEPFGNFPKDEKAEALAKELAGMHSASARAARLREEIDSVLGVCSKQARGYCPRPPTYWSNGEADELAYKALERKLHELEVLMHILDTYGRLLLEMREVTRKDRLPIERAIAVARALGDEVDDSVKKLSTSQASTGPWRLRRLNSFLRPVGLTSKSGSVEFPPLSSTSSSVGLGRSEDATETGKAQTDVDVD